MKFIIEDLEEKIREEVDLNELIDYIIALREDVEKEVFSNFDKTLTIEYWNGNKYVKITLNTKTKEEIEDIVKNVIDDMKANHFRLVYHVQSVAAAELHVEFIDDGYDCSRWKSIFVNVKKEGI